MRNELKYVWRHALLMGKTLGTITGAGGAAGLYGLYLLIHQHDEQWYVWVIAGIVAVFVAQVFVVQRALRAADEAPPTVITQKFVDVGEGASAAGLTLTGNQMIAGPLQGTSNTHHRVRRWLTAAKREELANHCEVVSNGILEMLQRDGEITFLERQADWDAALKRDEERRAETARLFSVEFAAKARDLLNRCAEAGYSMDRELELFRTVGFVNEITMRRVGEGLGILASRIRRKSRKV